MKKGLIILAVLLIALAAGGFFPSGEKENKGDWRPGRPLAREDLRIGVLYLSDPAENDDSGYAYAHETGIRKMREELGLREDQIIRATQSDVDARAIEHAIRGLMANGANVIIATSYGYMEVCERMAAEFPGAVFAHAAGDRRNDANFTNYFGRIYEARYLAGRLAGLRTATNKIGYVAAMGKENSEVTGGLNAFALGVESVNPRAAILVRTTYRWYDPEGEALAARRLVAAGCDVLAQHVDTSAPMLEAEKAGIFGLGYNSDMAARAPGAVLASVVWNWEVYYIRLIRSLLDGTFTTEPYVGSLKDGLVGLSPLNEALAPRPAAADIAETEAKIKDGSFHIFEGALKTNDGRLVGSEGKIFEYREIMEGMHWYYHNIRESEDSRH